MNNQLPNLVSIWLRRYPACSTSSYIVSSPEVLSPSDQSYLADIRKAMKVCSMGRHGGYNRILLTDMKFPTTSMNFFNDILLCSGGLGCSRNKADTKAVRETKDKNSTQVAQVEQKNMNKIKSSFIIMTIEQVQQKADSLFSARLLSKQQYHVISRVLSHAMDYSVGVEVRSDALRIAFLTLFNETVYIDIDVYNALAINKWRVHGKYTDLFSGGKLTRSIKLQMHREYFPENIYLKFLHFKPRFDLNILLSSKGVQENGFLIGARGIPENGLEILKEVDCIFSDVFCEAVVFSEMLRCLSQVMNRVDEFASSMHNIMPSFSKYFFGYWDSRCSVLTDELGKGFEFLLDEWSDYRDKIEALARLSNSKTYLFELNCINNNHFAKDVYFFCELLEFLKKADVFSESSRYEKFFVHQGLNLQEKSLARKIVDLFTKPSSKAGKLLNNLKDFNPIFSLNSRIDFFELHKVSTRMTSLKNKVLTQEILIQLDKVKDSPVVDAGVEVLSNLMTLKERILLVILCRAQNVYHCTLNLLVYASTYHHAWKNGAVHEDVMRYYFNVPMSMMHLWSGNKFEGCFFEGQIPQILRSGNFLYGDGGKDSKEEVDAVLKKTLVAMLKKTKDLLPKSPQDL